MTKKTEKTAADIIFAPWPPTIEELATADASRQQQDTHRRERRTTHIGPTADDIQEAYCDRAF